MRKKIYLAGKSSSYVFSSIQDTWHFGTDLDPRIHTLTSGSGSDSDCFFQDADKKYLLHISFWMYIYIILQRQEVIKDVTKQYKLSFFIFFFLVMERSGSGRPKNFRIRFRNSGPQYFKLFELLITGYRYCTSESFFSRIFLHIQKRK